MGLRLDGGAQEAAAGVANTKRGAGKTAEDGGFAMARSADTGEGGAPEGEGVVGLPSSASCQEALERLPLPLPLPLF